jgi:hypothetical protein
MATIDECIEFALKNIGLWWRYGISRHCDEWKYIIIGRIFVSEIILISPSLKISESSSNGNYRNTDEVWWRYGIIRSCDEWVTTDTQRWECHQYFSKRIYSTRTITRRSQGLAPGLSFSIILIILSMCGTKISQEMTPARYHLTSIL